MTSLRIILGALFVAFAVAGAGTAVKRSSNAHTVRSPSDVIRTGTSQTGSVTGFDAAIHLTNEALATEAELIVIGECIGAETVWVDRNLYTVATITVSESLKGSAISAVRVALPGGVDANRRFPVAMTYPGAPQISPREEVFLFLTSAEDEVPGSYAVMGFAQGKFSIVPSEQGPLVGRSQSGLQLLADNKVVRADDRPVRLSAFKEEIRSYLKQR